MVKSRVGSASEGGEGLHAGDRIGQRGRVHDHPARHLGERQAVRQRQVGLRRQPQHYRRIRQEQRLGQRVERLRAGDRDDDLLPAHLLDAVARETGRAGHLHLQRSRAGGRRTHAEDHDAGGVMRSHFREDAVGGLGLRLVPRHHQQVERPQP